MTIDTHIDTLLEQCSKDQVLSVFAWQLLQLYRQRGLAIATAATDDGEKQRMLLRSREKLRTDLCDLLQPMTEPEHTSYLHPSPATDGTQQPTPGA